LWTAAAEAVRACGLSTRKEGGACSLCWSNCDQGFPPAPHTFSLSLKLFATFTVLVTDEVIYRHLVHNDYKENV